MTTHHTLSIVVCSYNGATKLGDCLDALARQTLLVDVLVIDDGSTDGTDLVAQQHGFPVIRHEKNLGLSAARNTGLRNAGTSVVAFCDDDCIPPANWTERLFAAWTDSPDVAVLGGLVVVDNPVSFTQRYLVYRHPLVPLEIELAHSPSVWYRFARQFRPPRFVGASAFPVYSVVGANMSVNRARTLEAGGFDETVLFGEGEEAVLSELQRGLFGEQSVVVDPRVVMGHRFDREMSKTWRRSFVYGRGAAERWQKHGGLPSLPIVGPVAIVGTALLAPFSWPLGLSVGMLALGTPWVNWISLPNTKLDATTATYPLVALVDDLAGSLGFLRGISGKLSGKWNFP
ncbi:MAG TPA: glycosyltransferase [Acidimicrobiales bacterium]|nr:glycosyltransferase [Acidimicrobiales bacterium]